MASLDNGDQFERQDRDLPKDGRAGLTLRRLGLKDLLVGTRPRHLRSEELCHSDDILGEDDFGLPNNTDVFGWTKDCWTIFNGTVKVSDEDPFYNYTTLDVAEQPVLHHIVGAVDRKGGCGRLYLALFNFFRIADDKPIEDSEIFTARCKKQTPLHRAARAGHPLIIDQLFNVGPNANATDNFGRTVLCLAAHNGNSEMVKILCDNMTPTGRDRTDSNARNALHYAVLNHNEEAAFSLIERGIDINVLDHLGRPPVLYAAMNDMGRVAKLLQPIAVFFEDPVRQMELEILVKRAQVDREKLLGEQKGVLDPDVDMKAPSATANN